MAGYYGRSNIGALLRKIIIGLYITGGVLIMSNAIIQYQQKIAALAAMEYPFQFITSMISTTATIAILVVGTISAKTFFVGATDAARAL